MKGLLITERVVDSVLDWTHGWTYLIQRLLVPEAKNLVITAPGAGSMHEGQFYAWVNFRNRDYQVVREIEVPDSFVREVLAFIKTRENLRDQCRVLLDASAPSPS